jgi:putative cardiolipin synthase
VLAAGPVTNDISKSFDDYWASASSYPLRVLNHQRFDPKDLDAVRDELRSTGATTPTRTTRSR